MRGSSKRRSRWQFSLRFLLGAMFVFCLMLGAFMWRYRRAQEQARTISELKAIGCSVAYDFEIRKGNYGELVLVDEDYFTPKAKSPVPEMLIRLLGPDFFHDVSAAFATDLHSGYPQSPDEVARFWRTAAGFRNLRMVQCNGYWCKPQEFNRVEGKESIRSLMFSGYDFSKEHLQTIGSMPNLEDVYLDLLDSEIDDNSLDELCKLRRLRSFSIRTGRSIFKDPPITDEGVRGLCRSVQLESVRLPLKCLTNKSAQEIAKLPHLRRLDLSYSQLTDAGIAHFKTSLELEEIVINHTGVSGPGFLQLQKLSRVRKLCMQGAPVGDEDLEYVNVFRQLEILDLSNTFISDQGLKQHGLPQNLVEIELNDTAITDLTLQLLAQYSRLKKISLVGTKTTSQGISQLSKALPGCEISADL